MDVGNFHAAERDDPRIILARTVLVMALLELSNTR